MIIKFLILIIILILFFISFRIKSNFTTSIYSNNININTLKKKVNNINGRINILTDEKNKLQQMLYTLSIKV